MEDLLWFEHVGIWVAALLTLAILSFLYRDNPVYKLAEHVFVGVAAGYTICYSYWEVFLPNLFDPLVNNVVQAAEEGALWWENPAFWRFPLIIPLVLGLFFFARFSRNYSWLSRMSIAFLVGCYAGVNATGYFQGDLILQAKGTFYALAPGNYPDVGFPSSGEVTAWAAYGKNLPILLGVMASLTYFFFSKAHTGFVGGTARIGIWFLMVSFGASFGYTVMARVSLFIGRVGFLFEEWIQRYLL